MANCPFCGVTSDAPHETQEACIAALNVEIARMRDLIERVHPVDMPVTAEDEAQPRAWHEGV